jgi:RND family efflux transporter MFP subunit
MNVRKAALLVLVLSVAAAASACSEQGEGSVKNEASGRPPVAVEVGEAVLRDVEETIDVVGSLSPKFAADLKSEFTAVVEEVYVNEWVRVKKGTPLVKLDTREGEAALEAARAALLQAEVAETRAVRELERAEKLVEVGLVTVQNLDDARTAREAAAAATSAAKAQVQTTETRLAKAVIRAPFDGIVANRNVNPGDRVENMGGETMFRVVDNRILELTVNVPSTSLASLQVGQPLEFATDALPGRTFGGRVMFINPTADPVSRSVRVVADVPNEAEELRGGLFAKGRILTGKRTAVLQVPRTALQAWDLARREAEVFVAHDETAERRTVKTGAVLGEYVEVREGISAGERLVTRGAFHLRDGDRITVTASREEVARP